MYLIPFVYLKTLKDCDNFFATNDLIEDFFT